MRLTSLLIIRSFIKAFTIELIFVLLVILFCNYSTLAETQALLIGIDNYATVRPLKGATNDALKFKEILISDLKVSENNIQLLLNEKATKKNILTALNSLVNKTKPGDTIIITYSGHGWYIKDIDNDEAMQNPNDKYDEVLVPYDVTCFPEDRATEPNSSMISDDEINSIFASLVGRRLLVIFDSCHSGTATRSLTKVSNSRSLYENLSIPYQEVTRGLGLSNKNSLDISRQNVFIAAASPTQSASDLGEYEGKRHGALSASIFRVIKQAGKDWQKKLTINGLFELVCKDMLNQGFTSQTPSISSSEGLKNTSFEQFVSLPLATEIAITQSLGAFDLRLESNQYLFEKGENLILAVNSNKSGYLYILDIDDKDNVVELFPNYAAKNNSIQANQNRFIPNDKENYEFKPDTLGTSTILAIVTTSPLNELDSLKLPNNFQPLNEQQKQGVRDILRFLQSNSQSKPDMSWAVQKVFVEVVLDKKATLLKTEKEKAKERLEKFNIDRPIVETSKLPKIVNSEVNNNNTIDDNKLTIEEQRNLPKSRPDLFTKLEKLAERYSPIFWQDIGESTEVYPWRDFFVRYDFDRTSEGTNWPIPPKFQDQRKKDRNRSLDNLLTPNPKREILEVKETPGVYKVNDKEFGETYQLDLRPYVYWTVITTKTHYFFHYIVFHAEDWKGLFGHTADLEGTTIVVDRSTEKIVAAFTLAHDDVQEVRSLDSSEEPNIQILVDPSLEERGLFSNDLRPIDGSLVIDIGRDGVVKSKEHQDIYVETKGHGQYGASHIRKSRYILYANFFSDDTFRAPNFDKSTYPLTDQASQILSKHKYNLVYIGCGMPAKKSEEKTMWGEYQALNRFSSGANPPWCWRDNLFFKTGWWKDPLTIKKIGSEGYLLNPYITLPNPTKP